MQHCTTAKQKEIEKLRKNRRTAPAPLLGSAALTEAAADVGSGAAVELLLESWRRRIWWPAGSPSSGGGPSPQVAAARGADAPTKRARE
ncbi:hypothetical protein GUJ93_ZPchr0005g15666 [Zizania palustris]|uniref:Uncharacterized protein n=1 Tax=Zizania palustris TaxID=103762 RepID=A0A8J5SM25_ZIZPA|nr:hypothetical protein GUJ93_ZPchr0005g15666 [Zizania palustris]